jgi:hypothetical protein
LVFGWVGLAWAQTPPEPMGAPGAPSARPPSAGEWTPGGPAVRGPAGAEYTQYVAPIAARNRFIIGGLLAWAGILAGGLLFLEKRRIAALALMATGLVSGVALMFSGAG